METLVILAHWLEKYGIFGTLIIVFALIWVYVLYSRARAAFDEQNLKTDRILDLYKAILDPEDPNRIYRRIDILRELRDIKTRTAHIAALVEEKCDAQHCPVARTLSEVSARVDTAIVLQRDEGLHTRKEVEVLSSEIRKMINEFFVLIRALVDRLGNGKKSSHHSPE